MSHIEEDTASTTAASASSAAMRMNAQHHDVNQNDHHHHHCHHHDTLIQQQQGMNDQQPLLMKSSTSLESIGTTYHMMNKNDEKQRITSFHHHRQYGAITTDPSCEPASSSLSLPKIVKNRWYSTRKVMSGLLTTCILAMIVLLVVNTVMITVGDMREDSDDLISLCEWNHHPSDESCPSTQQQLLLRHNSHDHPSVKPPIFSTAGIQMYLHLFDRNVRATFRNITSTTTTTTTTRSWGQDSFLSFINPLSENTMPLSSSSSSSSSATSSLTGLTGNTNIKNNAPTLVIAGKMTIDGQPCNIGQYNLKTNEWSLSERIQLSLYNSYSGGEVYSLLANHTSTTTTTTTTATGTSSSTSTSMLYPSKINNNNNKGGSSSASTLTTTTTKQTGSGELLVVGAFDTTYRNSQVTYCSVGMWDGIQLSKVGEGLCNSALSKGMKITTASLAGPQDVYVAGSFQTRTLIFVFFICGVATIIHVLIADIFFA